jgi:Domain of unknown function (DUF4781)
MTYPADSGSGVRSPLAPTVDPAAEAARRAEQAAREAAARAAEAARRAAEAEAAARAKAEASRIAAERAAEHAADHPNAPALQTHADSLQQQAGTDQADLKKAKAATVLADADNRLQQSRLNDVLQHRAPNAPSGTTIQAQADYRAAKQFDNIATESPTDTNSPLHTAETDTQNKMKAAKLATQAVESTKAAGGKPTAAQLAEQQKTQDEWIAAIQNELRVAGVDASTHGASPKAAIDAHQQKIIADVRQDGYFDAASLSQGLAPIVAGAQRETPAQRKLALAFGGQQAGGAKLVKDARAEYAALDAKADAAEKEAAKPVYGPFAPGSPAAFGLVSGPQQQAIQARADADAAKARLDALESAYGHVDPANPDDDTIGTVQAGYQRASADLDEADARAAYDKTLADPKSTPAQTKQAYDDWQAAVDQQTLMTKVQTAIDADALHLQALQNRDFAQGALDAAQATQPSLITTQNPSGASGSPLQPDGHDSSLGLNLRDPEVAKHIKLIDGHYVYETSTRGHVTQLRLGPAAEQLWIANLEVDATSGTAKKASTELKQTLTDQHGGPSGTGLDVAGWLSSADSTAADLTAANATVTSSTQTLRMMQQGMLPQTVIEQQRLSLGTAVQQQQIAQARVDATGAMQRLRDAQMSNAGGTTPKIDLAPLLEDVRAKVKKVEDLNATQALTPAAEAKLRTETLPTEHKALLELDTRLQAAKVAAEGAPTDAKLAADYRALADQYDRLDHRIAIQEQAIGVANAQRAGLAAPIEYAGTTAPGGIDLHTRTHSDAADFALTHGITPGADGEPVLSGLPTNIRPENVKVKPGGDGNWYVTFDKSSGAFAMRAMGGGRAGGQVVYIDGSNADDVAIEAGHAYKLDPAAARFWEATQSLPTSAKAALDQAVGAAQVDAPSDATGKLLTAPGSPAVPSPATLGADGRPAAAIDFNVDQTQAKADADAGVGTTTLALAKAQAALDAGGGDPVALQAAVADATADRDVALAQQKAIDSVLAWQAANRLRQDHDADIRAGRPLNVSDAKPPQEAADDLLAAAQSDTAQWHTARAKLARERAQKAVDSAQATYDAWLKDRPYLSPASAADSGPGQALQVAQAQLAAAERDVAAASLPAADAARKAFIAKELAPGAENDPHAMYELFMKDPKVMAQAIFNADYARQGGAPVQMHNRTELRNNVAMQFGFTPSVTLDPNRPEANAQAIQTQDLFANLDKARRDMLDKTVDQIVEVGGEQARVTVLPVVYAVDASTEQGGGLVKTALFKVESADGSGAKFVDDQGSRYTSTDDYRANNALPVEGVNLAMPKDGNFSLDANGNVELFTGDARTETWWQEKRRVYHVDMVVAGVALVGAVALEVGSLGAATPLVAAIGTGAGAVLLGGASVYGVATASQSLANRADHGQSINPFTDREAGLEWLNLGASALALPALGSAGKAAVLINRARRAGVAADLTAPGRFVSLTGKAAMATGTTGMADGGSYMAEHWDEMSSAEREQQGSMFLMNLASFGVRPVVRGAAHRLVKPPENTTPGTGTSTPNTAGHPADATAATLRSGGVDPAGRRAALAESEHSFSLESAPGGRGRSADVSGGHDTAGPDSGNTLAPGDAVDARGYTLAVERIGRRNTESKLQQVHDAGGHLDGVAYVVYPRHVNPTTGLVTRAAVEGLQGVRRADADGAAPAASQRRPGGTSARAPTAHRTLDEALAATHPPVEHDGTGSRFETWGDEIAIVSQAHIDAKGRVAPEGVVATVKVHRVDGKARATSYRLNQAHPGEVRVAWPEGYVPGRPLIRQEGSTQIDLLNAAPERTALGLSQFRSRTADLSVYAKGRELRHDDGTPYRMALPVPEGHFAIEMHGAPGGRWAQAGSGRAVTAADVAQMVKNHPDWHGQDVILYVCHAGAGKVQFRQELASALGSGVTVYGADATVYVLSRPEPGRPGVSYASSTFFREPGNLHAPPPSWRAARPGLDIVRITEAGQEVFGPGVGLGRRPKLPPAWEVRAARSAADPGTRVDQFGAGGQTRPDPANSRVSAPPATGRDASGAPRPPGTVRVGLERWSDVARHADEIAAAHDPVSGAPPATPPSAAEAAVLAALVQPPGRGARTRFVVSGAGPQHVVYDGQGVATKGAKVVSFKSFEAARRSAAARDGAWVHRIEPATGRQAPSRRGRAESDEVAGSAHVYADGSVLPFGIPNTQRGAPPPPTTVSLRLGNWGDVASHAETLVAQRRAAGPDAAPLSADEAALFERLTQPRTRGARVRFAVSNAAPHEAFGDTGAARVTAAPSFRSLADARAAAQAEGGAWVYRIEPPSARAQRQQALRGTGRADASEVVGGVHVGADGEALPLGIPNPQAAAWGRADRAALPRVMASAAGGVAGSTWCRAGR